MSKVVTDIATRWSEGIEHHPESIKLMKEMQEVDLANDLAFDLKTGGDGDNGELLMFIMDIVFEQRENQ